MSQTEIPADCVPLAESVALGDSPAVKPVFQAAVPIEIELPDGRKIGMAKPNMSLSEKVASVLQNVTYRDMNAMEVEMKRVKMLLYITTIDGVQEPKIADPIMRSALEQKLGDEVLDALLMQWVESFPAVDKAVLKVVKKS